VPKRAIGWAKFRAYMVVATGEVTSASRMLYRRT
jgi:hypothetical protein